MLPDRITPLPTVSDPQLIKSREAAAMELQEVATWLYELAARTYFLDAGSVELFSSYEFEKQKDAPSANLPAHVSLESRQGKFSVMQDSFIFFGATRITARYTHIPLWTLQKSRLSNYSTNTLDLHSKVAGKHQTTTNFSPFTCRIHQIAPKCKAPISWTDSKADELCGAKGKNCC